MAPNLNSRMARAFFDSNDAKRQKLRRSGGPSGPAPAPVDGDNRAALSRATLPYMGGDGAAVRLPAPRIATSAAALPYFDSRSDSIRLPPDAIASGSGVLPPFAGQSSAIRLPPATATASLPLPHFGAGTDGTFAPYSAPVDVSTFSSSIGDGTTAIDTTAKTITISYGTTTTALRGTAPATTGLRFRISWDQSGTSGGQAYFGTVQGGVQYRPAIAGVIGTNTFDFTATSNPLHISFQRGFAGTTTFSNISVTSIREVTWADLSPQPITNSTFTTVTTGTTTDTSTGTITIAATGSTTSARGSVATVVGKLYRLRWVVGGNSAFCLIGTANGGSQLKAATNSDPVGSRTFEFTASTTTTWIQFQRTTAGTATISAIALQEVV